METKEQRRGNIIYYDYKIGGFTAGEWLVYWTWLYFISEIDVYEYIKKIDYLEPEMPNVLNAFPWDRFHEYLRTFY